MSCCPTTYWCVNGSPVGVEADELGVFTPPEGATGEPYATYEEAFAVCNGAEQVSCDNGCEEPFTVSIPLQLIVVNQTGCMDMPNVTLLTEEGSGIGQNCPEENICLGHPYIVEPGRFRCEVRVDCFNQLFFISFYGNGGGLTANVIPTGDNGLGAGWVDIGAGSWVKTYRKPIPCGVLLGEPEYVGNINFSYLGLVDCGTADLYLANLT